ncbi:MAG: TonB-dependent receptor [Gammaproteobacteria bacterium]
MTYRIRVLQTIIAAVTSVSPALAQQATKSNAGGEVVLEEIVVTAQKRVERLIDVPQSISVISSEDLTRGHAERFSDYFTRIPSASIVESQAGDARLILRGINTGGVGATVATYVDETPYGSATSLANGAVLVPDFDPFDLDRVEVLRGPQGTLYGANSLGGLVKFVPIAPTTDAIHASAEVGMESVDNGETGWSARSAVNLPVTDTAAVRASGFYRDYAGYIEDPKRSGEVNGGKAYGGRISGLYQPTDAFSLRGTVFVQDLESNGSNEVDSDPLTLQPTHGEFSQSRLADTPNDIKYRIYNVTADYDFGPTTLVSSTSWGTLDQKGVVDASGLYGALFSDIFGQPLGAALDANVTQRRFTEEVRLASSGDTTLEWTIGAFYTHEKNAIIQALNGIDDPTGAPIPDFADLFAGTDASTYREVAGFASGTYHFTPKWALAAGARYSHNKQRDDQNAIGPLAGGGFSFTGDSSDSAFTYSVAPSFKPNEQTTFYARVARGYRPGGPNLLPFGAPDTVSRQFSPDTTTDYEVGVKTELLERRLAVELTGFYTDWKDIQLFASVEGFGINQNSGGARSKGIELSLTARPIQGLTLSASGSYIDAALTDDAPDVVGGLSGDRLPYAPRFSSTLGVDYERPLTASTNGTAGLSWHYTGTRDSAFDTSYGQRELSAFSQVDAHAGVSIARYRIDAYVRNLTDSRGITNVGAAGSAQNGDIAVAVTRPRSFGVTLGVRF